MQEVSWLPSLRTSLCLSGGECYDPGPLAALGHGPLVVVGLAASCKACNRCVVISNAERREE